MLTQNWEYFIPFWKVFFSFLTFKAPAKILLLKIISAEVVCCIYLLTLLSNVSVETNSVDPDQSSPIGAV